MPGRTRSDDERVIWPVAALAILLLGFVVVYGSALQSRLDDRSSRRAVDDSTTDTEATL